MQPRSKHVAIRNTKKQDNYKIAEKLDELVGKWNTGNEQAAEMHKVVDLSQIPSKLR